MAQDRHHRQDERSGPRLGGPVDTPLAHPGSPSVEPRDSVGDLLRTTRERYGEDLPAVAQALRIRLAYLQAIESGRYQDLPGPTYAIGFLRTYAEFLGLDGRDIVRRFKEEVGGIERKPRLVFPTPMPEGKVPGGAVVLVSTLLVAAAYGVWFYLSDPEQQVADLVPPVPERLQALVGADGESAAPPAGGPSAAPEAAMVARAPLEAKPSRPVPAPVEPVEVVTLETERAAESPSGTDGEQTLVDVAMPSPVINSVNPVQVAEVNQDLAAGPGGPDAPLRATMARPTSRSDFGTGSSFGSDPSSAEAAEGEIGAESEAAAERLTLAEVVEAQPAEAAALDQPEQASAAEAAQTETAQTEPAETGTAEAETPASAAAAQSAGPDAALAFAASSDAIPAAPTMVQLSSLGTAREPQVYGADNEDARIVLRAVLDSWVQVRDRDDSLLLTRVLREGDSYHVPNRPGLVLLTGNAGGLQMVVDGKKLAPIGPVGSVRRDIPLDPDKLIADAAARR